MNESLLKAYQLALYRVKGAGIEFELRVGERSQDLKELLNQHQVETWAFVTAANPQSQVLTEQENIRRNQELEKLLIRDGYVYFTGESCSADGGWPVEVSFLILGISETEALRLASQFQQKAILFGGSSGIPLLKFL
ncbi:MAG: DUF3293 domain-containing protein [Deltaproteobacteria bacterium]